MKLIETDRLLTGLIAAALSAATVQLSNCQQQNVMVGEVSSGMEILVTAHAATTSHLVDKIEECEEKIKTLSQSEPTQ